MTVIAAGGAYFLSSYTRKKNDETEEEK